MRKITILINEETEIKFQYILEARAQRKKWQKLPSYKDVMITAIDLLYNKEKSLERTRMDNGED